MTYQIDEQSLRDLHAEGLGNREIARRLEVPHWVIGRRLQKVGLVTNRARGIPPEPIDADHSRCSKCQQVVCNDDFPFVTNSKDGRRLSYCRSCRTAQSRAAIGRDPASYWRDKQQKICRNRRGWDYNLPPGYLLTRWEAQAGRCFYTDHPLVTQLGSGCTDDTPSVDRVNSARGYVVGNVVICQNRVNTLKRDATLEEMRLWMPSWYARALTTWT